jgi:hypothetical protein
MHHHGTSGSRTTLVALYLPGRQSQTHWSGAVRWAGIGQNAADVRDLANDRLDLGFGHAGGAAQIGAWRRRRGSSARLLTNPRAGMCRYGCGLLSEAAR